VLQKERIVEIEACVNEIAVELDVLFERAHFDSETFDVENEMR
jgi:hypothetical protein